MDKKLPKVKLAMETAMMATLVPGRNLKTKFARDSWVTIPLRQRTLLNEELVPDCKDPHAVHLACTCALRCKEQIYKFLCDLSTIWYTNWKYY